MGVAFEELAGSPRIRIADGRFTGVRQFQIAWQDSVAFGVELLGGYQAVDGALVFSPPAEFPGVPAALVRAVEFEAFPEEAIRQPAESRLDGSSNQPWYARVTATYRIADHARGRQRRRGMPRVPEGTYLSYRGDFGFAHAPAPGRGLEWDVAELAGERVPADQANGVLIPTEEFTLTWERVPWELVPWDAIRDLRGRTNASEFLNHGPETVLFLGAKTAIEFQLTEVPLARLEYQFSAREVTSTADPNAKFGWNHLYRAEALEGEHWLPVRSSDGAPLYASADFAPLFEFE